MTPTSTKWVSSIPKAWFGDFSTAIAPLDHKAVVEILKASL